MDPTTEVTANLERPQAVTRAVQLFSASLAIGGIRAVFDLTQRVAGVYFFIALLILVLFLGIFFFFISRVAAGRNWARILLLILLLIGLPFAMPGYVFELKASLLRGSLSVLVAILQIVGMCLLFTKDSNGWFRRRK
jgi:4-amino-4-deoxy-L-arabinose transferase-like glycosyltransferase